MEEGRQKAKGGDERREEKKVGGKRKKEEEESGMDDGLGGMPGGVRVGETGRCARGRRRIGMKNGAADGLAGGRSGGGMTVE